jgi:hypothetical protein
MKKIALILLILMMSCELQEPMSLCGNVVTLEWCIKSDPIIKVPYENCLNYMDVRVLLYDDNNQSELIERTVKKDTIILNAVNIDKLRYQKNVHICEIYLLN